MGSLEKENKPNLPFVGVLFLLPYRLGLRFYLCGELGQLLFCYRFD